MSRTVRVHQPKAANKLQTTYCTYDKASPSTVVDAIRFHTYATAKAPRKLKSKNLVKRSIRRRLRQTEQNLIKDELSYLTECLDSDCIFCKEELF